MTATLRPRRLAHRVRTGHAALVYVFFYAPILLLVIYSFSADRLVGRWGGFTLDWYEEFWNNEQLTDSIAVSIRVAIISTIVSVVLGTLSALALERFTFRGRRVFDALLYLPIIIPDVTMGIMMLVFFAEAIEIVSPTYESIMGEPLTKGVSTIIVSHIAFNISVVSVVVRPVWPAWIETRRGAMDLYANRWQTFRFVTFPQILPGWRRPSRPHPLARRRGRDPIRVRAGRYHPPRFCLQPYSQGRNSDDQRSVGRDARCVTGSRCPHARC